MDPLELKMRSAAAFAAERGDDSARRAALMALADLLEEQQTEESVAEAARVRAWLEDTDDRPAQRPTLWPDVELIPDVTRHQRDALRAATLGPLGVMVGSPGTGKTRAAAHLIMAILQQRHRRDNLALCAPTGKAAVRLSQAVADVFAGNECLMRVPRASTIHQLLEIGRNGHDGGGWGFQRDRNRPLAHRYVVVDEASLLATDLAADLIDACGPGTHVLLVGDTFQLPPVGHGAPLRDMIAAGLPCGTLTEIHRNAGAIVRACAAIKAGEDWEPCPLLDEGSGENLRHIECAPAQQVDAVLAVLASLQSRGYHHLNDVQVICAVNNRSAVGRTELNKRLQDALNPSGLNVSDRPPKFRARDRVMCQRNGWFMDEDSHEPDAHYVANGEVGSVLSVAGGEVCVLFQDPTRQVLFQPTRGEDGDEEGSNHMPIDLAYAVTGHKCQGSQYPAVVIVADESPSAQNVCDAHWWYTALSRTRRACITVGRWSVIRQQCRRQTADRRRTFLMEAIRDE